MRTTIELPPESQNAVREFARRWDLSDDQALDSLVRILLGWAGLAPSVKPGQSMVDEAIAHELAERLGLAGEPEIRTTPSVLGGDARIRNTRIPVWLLVAHKKWGESDSAILAQYPGLNAADLLAAWDYYTANSERIDAERRANEEAA